MIQFSGQMVFSFACRFNLSDVEKTAKRVRSSLEKKQESQRPPKADKEAHDMTNKLRKIKKSIEKQRTM